MQHQATEGTKNIIEEFSKLSQGTNEKLRKITKDYVQILDDNYKGIKLPTLNAYISEQSSSIGKNDIDKIITKSTKKETEYYEVSTSHWYNPFSWGDTETRSRTKDVFVVEQFYANLNIKFKNVIDRTFSQIKKNVEKNTDKLESFQEELNNQIEDMMSKLQDMDKYSNDIELLNRTKKELGEFLNIINLHQELITKF